MAVKSKIPTPQEALAGLKAAAQGRGLLAAFQEENAPTLRAFRDCRAYYCGVMGPVGSGKSTRCVKEIITRAHDQDPGPDGIRRSRWVVIRNTYPQLQDTTIKTFFQLVPPQTYGSFNVARKSYLINRFPGVEIEVLFRALDTAADVANLLSLEVTGAWINEAREVPREIVETLATRTGRYPSKADGGATWHGILMDTNPPDTNHWWYNLFEKERPPNAEIFKQPSGRSVNAENIANLPAGYYDNLVLGRDEGWIQVYVDGEYGMVKEGMPVYPGYRDNLHCRPCPPIPGMRIVRGWDFGLTPACVFAQSDAHGRLRVIDELCATRSGIEDFSEAALRHCRANYPGFQFDDIGDPAGNTPSQTDERSCFDILRAKGIDIQPGIQTLTMRLESVRKGLSILIDGEPGLQVDPKAELIRVGFQGGYRFRRLATRAEAFTDQPEKNKFSHPHDALQYIAAAAFSDGLRDGEGFSGERQAPPQKYAFGYSPFGGAEYDA